jgi:hypothetical protein
MLHVCECLHVKVCKNRPSWSGVRKEREDVACVRMFACKSVYESSVLV